MQEGSPSQNELSERASRIANVFIEEISLQDYEQRTLTPVVNAFQLLVQKPMILTFVGSTKKASKGIILGHSIRRRDLDRRDHNTKVFSRNLQKSVKENINFGDGSFIEFTDHSGEGFCLRPDGSNEERTFQRLFCYFNLFNISYPLGSSDVSKTEITFSALSKEELSIVQAFQRQLEGYELNEEKLGQQVEQPDLTGPN